MKTELKKHSKEKTKTVFPVLKEYNGIDKDEGMFVVMFFDHSY
jgi:hypothetical protein